jgi:hypothetical protein
MRIRTLACTVALVACGSSSSGSGSSSSPPPGSPSSSGGASQGSSGSGGPGSSGGSTEQYPPGPYGNEVGQTLIDFNMSGYRLSPAQTDSTKASWDTKIALHEFHDSKDCKCLVISVAATWCGECMQEQPAIIKGVADDKAFCALGVLQQTLVNGHEVDAARSDVDTWTQRFKQDFPVVLGDRATAQILFVGDGEGTNGSSVALPFTLVVRTDSMHVMGMNQGVRADIHDWAMGLCGN